MDGMTKEVPLYQAVAASLKQRILSGEYPPKSYLPSEHTLCDTFSVSRVTVRKALDALASEGFVHRRQGKGTYVTSLRIDRNLLSITSFHQTCTLMGLRPSTQIVRTAMVEAEEADKECFEDLHDQRLLEVTRLCLADDIPVMLEINRYAPALSWLQDEDLTGSVYALLKARGIEPDCGSHEISLRYADSEDAQFLQVKQGEALLLVVEAIRDKKGHMIHRSIQHVRGDRFTFRI